MTLLGLLEWPRCLGLFGLGLLVLYAPAFAEALRVWFKTDREMYSHSVFIFPLSAFVLYLQRRQIRQAERRPTAWGFLPLALGLIAYSAGYLLRLDRYLLWTLIPVLAGGILILHGPRLWRIARFSVYFLVFAAPFSYTVEDALNLWLKNASTTGTVATLELLGYPLLQDGTRISVPGCEIEVADACSGYKKFIALLAFSVLYGYLFAISPVKRALLMVVSIPIALLANVIRVAGLAVVLSAAGSSALHSVHDWAEKTVLVLAFLLFVGFGKLIGCRDLRFMPSSAS